MLRHASQYMIASVIAAVFGFLGTATFTRLLSPGDYGVYVIGIGMAGFVSSILFTWIRFSVMRLQSEGGQQDLVRRHWPDTEFRAVAAPILFPVMMHLEARGWQEVGCAIVLALGIGLVEMGQEIMRARFQVREFAIGAALRAILSFAFCLAAIELGWGGLGLLAGSALAYYASAAFSARTIWRGPRAKADLDQLRLFFRLGFVFTITGFVYTFQCSMDRLFLAWHSGEAFFGLYGASADLTRQIIQMPAGSIAAAAFPIAVSSLAQYGAGRARENLERFGEILLAVLVPAAIGLSLTAPYLASFLLGPAFRETAASIVPILAAGWLLQCFTQFYVHVSFHLAKRPEWSLLQGLTSVAVNVACIWPLTDAWGFAGNGCVLPDFGSLRDGARSGPDPVHLPVALFVPTPGADPAGGLPDGGAVLALRPLLPVPSAVGFVVLAASGMLIYALAAIGLNICEARTHLRTLGLRGFAAAARNIS